MPYDAIFSATSTASHSCTVTTGGVAQGKAMLAFVSFTDQDIGGPSPGSAPSGWVRVFDDALGIYDECSLFYKIAGPSEPTSYEFTKGGGGESAANSWMKVVLYVASGIQQTGNPINGYSATTYTTNDTILRGGSVTTTVDGCLMVLFGQTNNTDSATPPTGFTERYDNNSSGFVYVADAIQSSAGATLDKDATLAVARIVKKGWLICLAPNVAPGTPTITAPTSQAQYPLGSTISLTASGTDANGDQVKYRWTYDSGGGDVTIGDSALVASGAAATYSWATTGLPAGAYTLKCWTVDATGLVSASYASVQIQIIFIVLTAPAASSSHLSGTVGLTGHGYLDGAGSLRLQWEIDTNNPPSAASPDYDLITSALVAQGESVSVIGNVGHLDTWYARARTVDTSDATSNWSGVITFYVLEEIKVLSGSTITPSALKSYNRVICRAENSSPEVVATATNTTVSPTYAESPRVLYVAAPEGSNLAACQAIADAQLALHQGERWSYAGLRIPILQALKLQRGELVGVNLERMDVDETLPIIEMTWDVPGAVVEVVVGQFWEPRTTMDALLALAQKLQSLEKEAAV